jgi:hypothetical protein
VLVLVIKPTMVLSAAMAVEVKNIPINNMANAFKIAFIFRLLCNSKN